MKANWKLALMCAATLAFVACGPKDKPGKEDPKEPEEPEFVSPISVTDGTAADWDNLPAQYVVSATCDPNCSKWQGLKSVKVYADQMCLNVLAEINMDVVADLSWVPFHMYINADNSAATGGYGDEFADADIEVLLEGGIFSEGAPISYNPAVFNWYGEVGGTGWVWSDPTVTHDESDLWGALVGEGGLPAGISASQLIGTNMVEFQIIREGVPVTWAADEFSIGFDVQQAWSSCGVLPNAADAEDGSAVLGKKLVVKVDMGE